MKRAHLKFVITAILAIAAFLMAASITIQMIWFDSEISSHSQHYTSGARRLEAARAYRHETYNALPAIMFLAIAALFLGILAIRFYNHAKSEFSN